MDTTHEHLISRLQGQAGQTLLETIRASSHQLRAPCAGRATCGKCRVVLHHVSPDLLEPISQDEQEQLSPNELAKGVRLACLTRFAQDGSLDLELGDDGISIPIEQLEVRCDAASQRAAQESGQPLRVAIDIGTTTLAVCLVDLASNEILSVRTEANDQKSWGSDVVARIQAARDDPAALVAQHKTIVRQLDRLIHEQIQQQGRKVEELGLVAVAGNTTMLHLLLGADPSGMASLPFRPVFLETRQLPISEVGFKLPAACQLLLLPSVSAFVGADITVGVLATEQHRARDIELLLDIGTNGEMVLGNTKALWTTATAAGPAFEGAQISHGCPGIAGALDHAGEGAEGFWYTTINDAPLRGICGSGLLDLTAWLRRQSLMDETGCLELPDDADAFYPDPKLPVRLDQRDIRQLQLAKGAISAGITVLCQRAGIVLADIARVHLAGGFGMYLRPDSALDIGLLPPVLRGKVKAVGNTALKGAMLAITQSEALGECQRLSKSIQFVDLATDPDFQMAFSDGMLFPEDLEPETFA